MQFFIKTMIYCIHENLNKVATFLVALISLTFYTWYNPLQPCR